MIKLNFILKKKAGELPKNSGVYCFKNEKKILYIGKAANLRERVKQHLPSLAKRGEAGDEAKLQRPQQPGYRDNLFLDKVEKIGYIKTNSTIEALILEANLIKKYQPKYNVVWRDDKNYFYVGITKEDFPRIFITHQTKLKIENYKLKIDYIGPFVDGEALKQTLKMLQKVFPYRRCKTLAKRPCLWYQLGRCPAPCLLKISGYRGRPPVNFGRRMKQECQRNAKNLMKILKEGKNKVLKELRKEMKLASKNQDFETAGKIRDQIEALGRVLSHAKIFETVDVRHQQIRDWNGLQKILQKILKTKKAILRIEAYDVSNIQGQEATGSMVTFINGLPNKNFYRKFKIHPVKCRFAAISPKAKLFNRVKIAGKPNDIAMIKEVLLRRFKHPEWGLPDLILIDGGRAQLNAALQCLICQIKQIKVIALAKRKNKLFIEGQKKPILLKTLPREIFNLILQLRDEAHRFARKYHLKLREFDFFPKS